MRRRSLFLARLALRRRPLLYWLATGGLAVATALVVGGMTARAERAVERYGGLRPVAVAVTTIDVGDEVEAQAVEVRRMPAAFVPEGALSSVPQGQVAISPTYPGEPLLSARIAPEGLQGVAALLPEGSRALAVPSGPGALRLAVGDPVDVLATTDASVAEGIGTGSVTSAVATGAVVVDVATDSVTVAVDEDDAPAVATALTQGTVTLALSSP